MDKKQAEPKKVDLKLEKQALKDIEKAYKEALEDVKGRVLNLQNKLNELNAINTEGLDEEALKILNSLKQSKIYQLEYQKMLEKQINSVIEVLKQDIITTTEDFLYKVYENGFLGIQYDINSKGIPVTVPINPELIKDIVNKPIENMTFARRIGRNMDKFKKTIKATISRGIASGSSYSEIAQQLSMITNEALWKSKRIIRTEGCRVSSEARLESIARAKEKGADLVKVWDATLDNKTRELHGKLDGQVQEVDEPFEVEGVKVDAPGMFGDASQDCNCRCVLLSVPRWDLDDTYIKYDNENDILIETTNYEAWKNGYYRRVLSEEVMDNLRVDELKDIAKGFEVTGFSTLKKAELIEQILSKIAERMEEK